MSGVSSPPIKPFIQPAVGNADQRAAAKVEADLRANLEANLAIAINNNATVLNQVATLLGQLLAKRKPVPMQRFYYLTVGSVTEAAKHDDFALPDGTQWFVDQIQILAFAGVTGNPVVTVTGLWPLPLPLQATLNIPYVLECRVNAELDQHLDLSVAGGTGMVLVLIRYARAE